MAAGHPLSGIQIKCFHWFFVCFSFWFCFPVLPCCFVFQGHQFESNYAPLCYEFNSSSLSTTYPESTKKSQCEPGNPKADGQLSTVYCKKPSDRRFIYTHDIFSNNITHKDHVTAI